MTNAPDLSVNPSMRGIAGGALRPASASMTALAYLTAASPSGVIGPRIP